MTVNIQNKIAGRAFCTVGLNQEMVDGEAEWFIADAGILWRLNDDTLDEYNLGDDFLEDIVGQINSIGTLEDIRRMMGIQAFSGPHRGPVLRHSERPDITCMVTVMSGPNTGYNPNVYNYPYDLMLDCFVDVDNQMGHEHSDIEAVKLFFGALGDRRIGKPFDEFAEADSAGDCKNYLSEGVETQNYKEESASIYEKIVNNKSEANEDIQSFFDLADKYKNKKLDFKVVDAYPSAHGKGYDISVINKKYKDLPSMIKTSMVKFKDEPKKGDNIKATLYISPGGILIDKVH